LPKDFSLRLYAFALNFLFSGESYMTNYTLNVNQTEYEIDVPDDMPLLWALRDILGLTGTKYSCGIGLCGSCTVHVDGAAEQSCQVSVSEVSGSQITTIEGLAADTLRETWLAENVSQCGYCQPGQIMAAAALLTRNANPNDEDINAALADQLCRCGTYQRIRRAIHKTAEAGGIA
jgi:isoquinoline 1-oxidoreductase alpha subunit